MERLRKPGKAGWGVVIINGKEVLKLGEEKITRRIIRWNSSTHRSLKIFKNNISDGVNVEIVSDSKYVILGITEWIFNWQKNNWRNAGKKPVLNRELWEELYELTKEFKPKWTYVKGHKRRQIQRQGG